MIKFILKLSKKILRTFIIDNYLKILYYNYQIFVKNIDNLFKYTIKTFNDNKILLNELTKTIKILINNVIKKKNKKKKNLKKAKKLKKLYIIYKYNSNKKKIK